MGPLSNTVDLNMVLEQRRKNMKAVNEEIRKSKLEEAKLQSKNVRETELHAIKVAKELAKVEQVDGLNIGKYLKGIVNQQKAPLAAPTNPEAGPGDKVPALLTPGEAVIPAPAAQDPRNKPIIQELVNQGRAANAPLGTGMANQARDAILQNQMRTRAADPAVSGFADGTTKITPEQKSLLERAMEALRGAKPKDAPVGDGMVKKAADAVDPDDRKRKIDKAVNGYADGTVKVGRGPLAQNPGADDQFAGVKGFNEGSVSVDNDWLDSIMNQRGFTEEQKALAKAIYQQESLGGKLKTDQPNYAGARGPMQVIEPTFEGLKKQGLIPADYKWNNPRHSSEAGIALLQDGFNRYGNNPDKIAAYYFSGPDAIKGDEIIGTRKGKDGKTVASYVSDVRSRLNGKQPGATMTAEQAARQASAYDPSRPVASQATVDAINKKYAEVDAMVAPPPPVQDDMDVFTGVRMGNSSTVPPPMATPVAGVDFPKPITVKPEFPERGTTADAATIPPPEPNGTMPANLLGNTAERIRAFDDAMAADATRNQLDVLQKESAKVAPEERKSWLESQFAKVFGETGLFNERELIKFAILAAGGVMTGGSVGGSLRYAGIAAMNSAEKRYDTQTQMRAAQQAEAVKHIRNREEKLSDKQDTRINQLQNLYFTGLSKSSDAMKAKATDMFIESERTKDPIEKERKLQAALHYLSAEQAPTGSPHLETYVNRYDGLPYQVIVHGGELRVTRPGSTEQIDPKAAGMDLVKFSEYQTSRKTALDAAEARVLPILQRINSKGGKKVDPTFDEKAEANRIAQEASVLRYTLGRNMNDDDFAVVVENAMQGIKESGMKVSDINADAFRKYAQGEAVIATRKGSQLYTVKDENGKAVRPGPEAVAQFSAKVDAELNRVAKNITPAERNMQRNKIIEIMEQKYNDLPPQKKKAWESAAEGVKDKRYSPFLLWVQRSGEM